MKKTPKKTTRENKILNPRWALFVKYYYKGDKKTRGNIYRSAIKAGFSKNYAKTLSGRVMLEKVRKTVAAELDTLGVTAKYKAKKVKELLDAEVKIKIIPKKGKTIEIEKTDTGAIDAGLKHAFKIGGDYKEKTEDTESTERSLREIESMLRGMINKK